MHVTEAVLHAANGRNSGSGFHRRQILQAASVIGLAAPAILSLPACKGSPDVSTRIKQFIRLARDLFPHDELSDSPYGIVAETLVGMAADDTTNTMFDAGFEQLGEAWHEQPEEIRPAAIEAIEGTPFFATVRAVTASTLYAQPEVWELIGFEGPSLEYGGYIDRGFDDIDWLELPAQ